MTKEAIEKRIAMLQEQLEQVKANANALMGAIQDCHHWREQMTLAEEAPATPDALQAHPAP